jgi:hypothetical protein
MASSNDHPPPPHYKTLAPPRSGFRSRLAREPDHSNVNERNIPISFATDGT